MQRTRRDVDGAADSAPGDVTAPSENQWHAAAAVAAAGTAVLVPGLRSVPRLATTTTRRPYIWS